MADKCWFCDEKNMEELKIHREGEIRVIHNRFSFMPGQLLFVPREHKGIKELTNSDIRDLFRAICLTISVVINCYGLSSGFSCFCLEGKAAGAQNDHNHWHLFQKTGIFDGLLKGPYKKVSIPGFKRIHDLFFSDVKNVFDQILEIQETMIHCLNPDGFAIFFTDMYEEDWGIYICPRFENDGLVFGRSKEEREKDGTLPEAEMLASVALLKQAAIRVPNGEALLGFDSSGFY